MAGVDTDFTRGTIVYLVFLKKGGVELKKIVYFDEESALDWLDQKNDGRMEEINKDIIQKGKSILGEAEVEGAAGFGYLLNALKFRAKASVKGNYLREGTTVIEKTVSNTILTTFTKYINPEYEDSFSDEIEQLENFNLSLINNSFTYFKTITPIFKLFPSQISIDDNNLNEMNIDSLDLSNFDELIDNLKGYFEFRAQNEITGENKIVRFNSDSLRNNYRLTDFLSMNLVMYGIKVGRGTLSQFDIKNSFDTNEEVHTEVLLEDFDNDEQTEAKIPPNTMEIIDIILAGIE